ncbi:MAG: AAA family ATPase, partial [Candidatus Delongbacteria bacterium]|nr:AAA family ATPase [Candidatus Delongbacteria bacterium]
MALIIFGAPYALENMHSRACDFAVSVRSLKKLDIEPITGISLGMSFTGFVGSEKRCEYTAIGAVVNKAVRYLNRAQSGDILIDTNIYEKKKNDLIVEIFQHEKFKGFSEETTVFKIIKKKEKVHDSVNLSGFVGRDTERDKLLEYVKPIFDNKFGGFIYIDGNAGIGKTRLISEVKRIILTNKFLNLPFGTNNWFFLPCDPILKKSLNPFNHYFKSYFEQSDNNSKEINQALFEAKIYELINDISDEEIKKELERSKSFLGSLVNLFWADSLYDQVDPKTKYENTIYAIKNFVKAKSLQEPVVIEIPDGVWIDKDSSKVLETLTQNIENYPIIIISDTRYLDDGSEMHIIKNDDILIERIKLDKFSKELSVKLIENILNPKANNDISIPKQTVSFIRKKSEDNPFYIEQIILYLQKNDLLDLDFSLKNKDFEIPSSINSIIIARIDRLKNDLKKVIQTASVLGKEFNIKVLSGMLNNKNIEEELNEGEKENIWSVLSELSYLFKHALISESVYEMQLKKQL